MRPEPNNPADPRAIAVLSCRGIQLGYLTAERCGRIGQIMRQGAEVQAIFQNLSSSAAYIRVAFCGATPSLPKPAPDSIIDDQDFWPDPEWDD